MSAIKPLVLKDGASAPISHTFSPKHGQQTTIGKGKGSNLITPAKWSLSGPNTLLNKEVTLSQAVNANKTSVTVGKVKVPSVNKADAGCCGGDTFEEGLFTLDFRIPPHYTLDQRNDLYAFAVSLLASTEVKDAVTKNEVVY